MCFFSFVFFFKQKTAYEMRISDWSSDVCSSDLVEHVGGCDHPGPTPARRHQHVVPGVDDSVQHILVQSRPDGGGLALHPGPVRRQVEFDLDFRALIGKAMRRVAAVCRFDQAEQRFAVAPEAESPTHDLLVHGHAGLATHGWGKVGGAWSAAGRRGARMSVVGHAGVSADSAEKSCGTCPSRRLPGTRRARMWPCQATNGGPPGTYP